jgi:hypothetical protein
MEFPIYGQIKFTFHTTNHLVLMGKTSINGLFSMAMLNSQRVFKKSQNSVISHDFPVSTNIETQICSYKGPNHL